MQIYSKLTSTLIRFVYERKNIEGIVKWKWSWVAFYNAIKYIKSKRKMESKNKFAFRQLKQISVPKENIFKIRYFNLF